MTGKSIIETIILVLIVFGSFSFIFYHPVRRYFRRRSELRESPDKQAQNEPHSIRDLTVEEKSKLELMIKSANSFSKYYILGFSLILTYVLLINNGKTWDLFKRNYWLAGLMLLIPTLVAFSVIYHNRLRGKKMRKDLLLPVYQVQGKVYKETHTASRYTDFDVTVRGIMFNGKQIVNSNTKLFDLVNQDNVVSIEYSPNSKYVWKVS